MKKPLVIISSCAIAAVMMSALATHSVRAAVIVNIQQVGSDVQFTTEPGGSLNRDDWTGLSNESDGGSVDAELEFVMGAGSLVDVDKRSGEPASFAGPTSIGLGTGGSSIPDSGSGDVFGLVFGSGGPTLIVPNAYVSGNSLSGSSTYDSTTLAGLGLTIGSYTWTWDLAVGGTESITVNVIPEPTSMALLGLGAVALIRRRK